MVWSLRRREATPPAEAPPPGPIGDARATETRPVGKLDRYELGRPISKGAFATVFEAYDPRIKRPVAIKRCTSLDEGDHERDSSRRR